MHFHDHLRPAARDLDDSDIVGVMNRARGKTGLIPLWVGEGDLPTPEFITQAASRSLADGETFYTWQRGIPELREALAAYHAKHYGIEHNPERFFVTGSGMQSISLALQALSGAGDEVVMTTPCWPNIHAATQVAGGTPVHVPLDFSPNGWSLDVDRLFDAVTPRTRAIFINSPANPTGWTAPVETLRAIRDFARKNGLWIIADEVYSRFVHEPQKGRAPSFYDVMEAGDRIIFVNTFSKNWAMTGWRIGWISAPVELGQLFENLIQYSTSGVPTFVQRGAIAALEQGEDFLNAQLQKIRTNRDHLCQALQSTGKVEFATPEGAFYLFFRVKGFEDSKALVYRLMDEANVGLAPGTGFYTGGKPFLRLCYLRDSDDVREATARLVDWLNRL